MSAEQKKKGRKNHTSNSRVRTDIPAIVRYVPLISCVTRDVYLYRSADKKKQSRKHVSHTTAIISEIFTYYPLFYV